VSRPASPIEALRAAPERFDPMAALLVLERAGALAGEGRSAGHARVGEHAQPRDEAVRFATSPRLGFQPTELVRLDEEPGRAPRLTVAFMGLAAATGTLPQAYAELVLARLRDRDPTLAAFLDLFNHRAVSLFMRAWEKYRLPLQQGTPREDGVAGLIDALIGFGTDGLAGRIPGPHEHLRFFAGYLADPAHRPAAALQAMLTEALGEPVTLDQLVPRRERLAEEERTRLAPGGFARLGDEALLGESVLRVDGGFRLRLGPMGAARFRDLMPDRAELPRLVALARLFAGPGLHFEVRLTLRAAEIPPLRLGGGADGPRSDGPRLGWNTWMIDVPGGDRDDAAFSASLFG
jgi:type VI secretion system protein ImpH